MKRTIKLYSIKGAFFMLQMKQVSKVYEGKVPVRALSDINLEVERGDFVSIMGPSGSGKTTLLNTISTIDEPTRSEEHTSELQSRGHLVCRLLLEKKMTSK